MLLLFRNDEIKPVLIKIFVISTLKTKNIEKVRTNVLGVCHEMFQE